MTTEPKKTKPWIKVILVISIGLNLAVISFVIGILIKGPPDRLRPNNQDAVAFLTYALPVEHRREIRRAMVESRDELRSNREALRGLREEMILILQAEPFEIEKVAAILENQRSRFLSLGELAHDALLQRISELSPQERAVYVQSLKRDARPSRRRN